MRLFSTLFFLFFTLISFAQETLVEFIEHDGANRKYITYIPASYTGDEPVPLVFNFHGYGSLAGEQLWYGNFKTVADTANFIIVHPEGLKLDGVTHFNVGGWTSDSEVDDVGFTSFLLDHLIQEYNIDETRVYSTGMSNGGYMSFLLACQLSDRFAAVASVTGSMTEETYNECNPQHQTPVMQIHGTADLVVNYEGENWSKSIQDVLDYWINYNGCSPDPVVSSYADIDDTDGSTVERFVYSSSITGVTVEHLKVDNGGHTWPGSAFANTGNTNQDINASQLVWEFFAQYSLDGLVGAKDALEKTRFVIYPNPSTDLILVQSDEQVDSNYELYTALGSVCANGRLKDGQAQINVRGLTPGMYFLRIGQQMERVIVGEE